MVGPASLVSPTKLAIMPALALAVVIAVVPALAPTSDARTAPTIRRARRAAALLPVSYTHLTLPTKRIV